MLEMNLSSIRTHSKKEYLSDKRKQNILKQQFTVSSPNIAWVCDETYFKFNEKWFYICIFVDLFSRKVVAYKISKTNSTQLTKSTMKMAFETRKPPEGLILHTDNSSNYISATFSKYLTDNGIVHSFSKGKKPL